MSIKRRASEEARENRVSSTASHFQIRKIFLLLIVSLLTTGTASAQTILSVDRFDDTAAASDCLAFVVADCSLRGAILNANAIPIGVDVVILLSAGTYSLTIPGAGDIGGATGDLNLWRDMEIRGTGSNTVIRAGAGFDDGLLTVQPAAGVFEFQRLRFFAAKPANGRRAVHISEGNTASFISTTFDDNGTPEFGGGALFVAADSDVEISNSHFTGNESSEGGAALRSYGSLVVLVSHFSDNSSGGLGGAIRASPDGASPSSLAIARSVFRHNEAIAGGAIALFETPLTVDRSTFEDNYANVLCEDIVCINLGGAIYTTSSMLAAQSTFARNQAAGPGAAIWSSDSLELRNVTLSGHRDSGGQPTVSSFGVDVTLHHVTFYDNDLDLSTNGPDLFLYNSLFGTGCELPEKDHETRGNVALDSTCWADNPGPGDVEVADLALGPLGPNGGTTYTHKPEVSSPALGAGIMCMVTDQRGLARAAPCDSGAVELLDPDPALFFDGFESAAADRWSTVVY